MWYVPSIHVMAHGMKECMLPHISEHCPHTVPASAMQSTCVLLLPGRASYTEGIHIHVQVLHVLYTSCREYAVTPYTLKMHTVQRGCMSALHCILLLSCTHTLCSLKRGRRVWMDGVCMERYPLCSYHPVVYSYLMMYSS